MLTIKKTVYVFHKIKLTFIILYINVDTFKINLVNARHS